MAFSSSVSSPAFLTLALFLDRHLFLLLSLLWLFFLLCPVHLFLACLFHVHRFRLCLVHLFFFSFWVSLSPFPFQIDRLFFFFSIFVQVVRMKRFGESPIGIGFVPNPGNARNRGKMLELACVVRGGVFSRGPAQVETSHSIKISQEIRIDHRGQFPTIEKMG
jgi:hypothetical protein